MLEFPMKVTYNLVATYRAKTSDFSRRPFLLKIISERELEKFRSDKFFITRREISCLERNQRGRLRRVYICANLGSTPDQGDQNLWRYNINSSDNSHVLPGPESLVSGQTTGHVLFLYYGNSHVYRLLMEINVVELAAFPGPWALGACI